MTQNTKNLMRRLERLEHLGRPAWLTRLRAFARKLAFDDEEFLGIVKGHARQLAEHVDDDGGITWEGYGLLPPARRAAHRRRSLPRLRRADSRDDSPIRHICQCRAGTYGVPY